MNWQISSPEYPGWESQTVFVTHRPGRLKCLVLQAGPSGLRLCGRAWPVQSLGAFSYKLRSTELIRFGDLVSVRLAASWNDWTKIEWFKVMGYGRQNKIISRPIDKKSLCEKCYHNVASLWLVEIHNAVQRQQRSSIWNNLQRRQMYVGCKYFHFLFQLSKIMPAEGFLVEITWSLIQSFDRLFKPDNKS